MYLGQLIHDNIVVVSTVLARVYFSGHVPMQTQTEVAVFQTRSQMQSCGAH